MEEHSFINNEEIDIITENLNSKFFKELEVSLNAVFFQPNLLKKEDTFNEINPIKKDTSKKEETEDTKIISKQKQTVSQLSYNKSYSRTTFHSSIIKYTWEIDRATTIFETIKEFCSTAFPETALYKIKLNIDINSFQILESTLKFYLLTETEFTGVCKVFIIHSSDFDKIPCKSTSGLISNMTLLYETTLQSVQEHLSFRNSLVMYFRLEIFDRFLSESVHMEIIPSNTTLDKKSIPEYSNLNSKSKQLIAFKIKGECYYIPENILRATRSKYFKNICDTYEIKIKKYGSYEIEINDKPMLFKEMLFFILSGLMPNPLSYHKLRDLLMIADEYDVQHFKLICEQYLLCTISFKNAIDLIQLAHSCDAKYLEKHAALFIKLYWREIVRIGEFQLLSQSNIDKIIEIIRSFKIPIEYHDIKNPHLNT